MVHSCLLQLRKIWACCGISIIEVVNSLNTFKESDWLRKEGMVIPPTPDLPPLLFSQNLASACTQAFPFHRHIQHPSSA